MLRLSLALASATLLTASAHAQSLEEKYTQKLEKDFVSKIEWVRTLEEAQAAARKTGKPVFAYFTRSYAP
jgi:hypothetical protein